MYFESCIALCEHYFFSNWTQVVHPSSPNNQGKRLCAQSIIITVELLWMLNSYYEQFKHTILQTGNMWDLILAQAAPDSSLQSIFINKTGGFKKEKVSSCNSVLPKTAKVFIFFFAHKYFKWNYKGLLTQIFILENKQNKIEAFWVPFTFHCI